LKTIGYDLKNLGPLQKLPPLVSQVGYGTAEEGAYLLHAV